MVRPPIGFAAAFCLRVPFGNVLFSQDESCACAFYDSEAQAKSQLTLSYLRSGFMVAWIVDLPMPKAGSRRSERGV
jgi:hypothetical protein